MHVKSWKFWTSDQPPFVICRAFLNMRVTWKIDYRWRKNVHVTRASALLLHFVKASNFGEWKRRASGVSTGRSCFADGHLSGTKIDSFCSKHTCATGLRHLCIFLQKFVGWRTSRSTFRSLPDRRIFQGGPSDKQTWTWAFAKILAARHIGHLRIVWIETRPNYGFADGSHAECWHALFAWILDEAGHSENKVIYRLRMLSVSC